MMLKHCHVSHSEGGRKHRRNRVHSVGSDKEKLDDITSRTALQRGGGTVVSGNTEVNVPVYQMRTIMSVKLDRCFCYHQRIRRRNKFSRICPSTCLSRSGSHFRELDFLFGTQVQLRNNKVKVTG